jgi:hypothetical protein
MNIDFDSFFRNRIEAMLIKASWVGAIQSMLGLVATSQVWNGRAEWYLWLNDAPGVYALSFNAGQRIHQRDRRLHEGFFTIKCYPYRSHGDFTNYSPEERRLIESDWFDTTNTPCFEAQDQISDPLFSIGGLSMVIDPHGDIALMTFESLDTLKLHQGGRCAMDVGQNNGATPDSLIRNVAGWKTGIRLFDCLVGLYANDCRQPPVFAGMTCRPGFESILHSDSVVDCRPSRDCRHMSVSVGFDRSSETADTVAPLWRNRLASDEKILTAIRLPTTAAALSGRRFSDEISLNPLWWEIPHSNYRSELNTACGCAGGHCHHG